MMDRRLLKLVPESKKYIAGNIVLQWISLVMNVVMMTSIAGMLTGIYERTLSEAQMWITLAIAAGAILIRMIAAKTASYMSYMSSKKVKQVLREKIYRKLLALGLRYRDHASTAEVVQVRVEGVEQLETYFGAYLPQFFYAMLAPLTLFIYVAFYNLPAAVVLLICVPLIPVTIALVQTWAKKLLAKYWGQYTALGDTFLENLQGLTTLKIYQADERKQGEMNEQAEKFRKITMKVLNMQLNSVTIMDFIAYGGAALGIIMATTQYAKGNVSLTGAILIILLSADFFLPMRQLGSYFHVAMNGMAASGKIFRLLSIETKEIIKAAEESEQTGEIKAAEESGKTEREEKEDREGAAELRGDLRAEHLTFTYEEEREVLRDISFVIPESSFTAIVGASGSGKSTLAALLTGRERGFKGNLAFGDEDFAAVSDRRLLNQMTYIGHRSYLFKGTVEENLRMASPNASEEELWEVLSRVKLEEFLKTEKGLATELNEGGSNFSGGQRQRLALARALLKDTPMYIFDEATSNIDVESENDIVAEILRLAKTKTVVMIAHRLANVTKADQILVLEEGVIVERGTHEELLEKKAVYADLWKTQYALESFGKEVTV